MHILDDKYPFGTKAMLSAAAKQGIIRKVFNKPGGTIFTKVKPQENYTPVILSKTGETIFLENDGIIYKLQGSKSAITNGFVRVKEITNITQYLESTAILGVFGITNIDDVKKFSGNKDELGLSISEFESLEAYKEEATFILRGTSKFKPVPNDFIHKNIKEYYKALESYENLNAKGSKPNTSDVVFIYEGTKNNLLSELKSKQNEILVQEDGLIQIGTVKFKQVSLKKGEESARLGRITTYIKSLVNEISETSETSEASEEPASLRRLGIITDDSSLINEMFGIFDVGKGGFKYFVKLTTALKKFISSLNLFKAKKMEAEINKLISTNIITESAKVFNFKKIKDSINNNIKSIQNDDVFGLNININKLKEPKTVKEQNLLIANQLALTYIKNILDIVKKNGAKSFIDNMETYMRKGNTKLPIVMLYGDGKTEVLTSKDIQVANINIKPIYLDIHNSKDGNFYVINLYTISKIDSGIDPLFTKIQFTNAGGTDFSFKVEGNTIVRFSSLKKILLQEKHIEI